jgi:hypothetical protein
MYDHPQQYLKISCQNFIINLDIPKKTGSLVYNMNGPFKSDTFNSLEELVGCITKAKEYFDTLTQTMSQK